MPWRFWKKDDEAAPPSQPIDIAWTRDDRGYYWRLLRLRPAEAGLKAVGGVYVMWHRGPHPKWIHVGATDDLETALEDARSSQAVLAYEGFGSVYVTWAEIRPEYRSGVVLHLRETLHPEIDETLPADRLDAGAPPIPVTPPS
jgi:hypothetical protein